MEFQLLAGEWDHPQYPGPLHAVGIAGGSVRFEVRRSSSLVSGALVLLISLALGAAIFLLFWLLFKAMVLIVFFIPPLALALLRSLGLGPKIRAETIAVPLAAVRNVGGGGNLVAFGLELPGVLQEVAVLLHMLDAAEAERLRIELRRA